MTVHEMIRTAARTAAFYRQWAKRYTNPASFWYDPPKANKYLHRANMAERAVERIAKRTGAMDAAIEGLLRDVRKGRYA